MKIKFPVKGVKPVTFQNKLMLSYIMIIMVPVLSALLIYGVNLYNQTKEYYEDLLQQLNNKTNVNMNDFISNLSLNSFFYLTDPTLKNIITKNYSLESKEYVENLAYVQRSLNQLILMNRNMDAISVLAPNGRIYSSYNAFEPDMHPVVETMDKQGLANGDLVVSSPYEGSKQGNKAKTISIVRYLTDLNLGGGSDSYVKIDIPFSALENILGGITNSNSELGTLVILDGEVIYHSSEPSESYDSVQMQEVAAAFEEGAVSGTKSLKLGTEQQSYMFSVVENDYTKWKVVHYLPARLIDQTFLTNTRNYIAVSLISLIAAGILALFFSKRFINPINKLNIAMKLVDSGFLEQVPTNKTQTDELGRLVMSYNNMIHRLKESRELEIVSGQLQKRAEMNMLQAQINPHFLYNTLNVIHSVAELNRVGDISIMARSLSAMYRYNIKTGDEMEIQHEIEQINNYVTIQQIRFFGKFQVIYDIEEELYPYKILKFLVQPIVENAFYHGLEPKGGKGILSISIRKSGHLIVIRVQDDGVGIAEDKLTIINNIFDKPFEAASLDEKDNFGLRNVHARIKNFYGKDYWIKAYSKPHEGTCIEIAIPVVKGDEYE
ncbi:cache domain-containing sensor histidine kinase [Paenibacillus endoradicis]|uniref:cache domain-containing sensor histidine kinase n=1 Tax=Paenibacillus endoradicis TaxID=2972487 RepID=UPI0021592522|nr:histidine kinase [Paenibacillus endoradicis]MCR8658566.1 histidine kinase [Paenibacillus endoradicis]